jgi:hypothetical protein
MDRHIGYFSVTTLTDTKVPRIVQYKLWDRPQWVTTGKNTGRAGCIILGRPQAAAVETVASVEPLKPVMQGMVPGPVLTTVVTQARRLSETLVIPFRRVPICTARAAAFGAPYNGR